MFALAVTALCSFSAQAGDWPKTTAELLAKKELSFNESRIIQIVLDLKKKTYKKYKRQAVRPEACREQAISEIVEVSEYAVEFRALKEKECDAKVITINLKEKNISLLAYEGERTNVKEMYTVNSADFD